MGKSSVFFVWAVLHHSMFSIKIPVSVECGYTKATVNLSFDGYWYLAIRTVLQANDDPRIAGGSD